MNYLSSSDWNFYRNRKRRSLEDSENGATEEPARDIMETAEVSISIVEMVYYPHCSYFQMQLKYG